MKNGSHTLKAMGRLDGDLAISFANALWLLLLFFNEVDRFISDTSCQTNSHADSTRLNRMCVWNTQQMKRKRQKTINHFGPCYLICHFRPPCPFFIARKIKNTTTTTTENQSELLKQTKHWNLCTSVFFDGGLFKWIVFSCYVIAVGSTRPAQLSTTRHFKMHDYFFVGLMSRALYWMYEWSWYL